MLRVIRAATTGSTLPYAPMVAKRLLNLFTRPSSRISASVVPCATHALVVGIPADGPPSRNTRILSMQHAERNGSVTVAPVYSLKSGAGVQHLEEGVVARPDIHHILLLGTAHRQHLLPIADDLRRHADA